MRFAFAGAAVAALLMTTTSSADAAAHKAKPAAHHALPNSADAKFKAIYTAEWKWRETQLASPLFGADVEKIRPLLRDYISDSASLDGLLELLVLGGRSAAHAMSMLIPEAHRGRPELSREVCEFYAYHSSLVEPWDGPAAVAFSDGRVIGATLDRNGLRPGRWLTTGGTRSMVELLLKVVVTPPPLCTHRWPDVLPAPFAKHSTVGEMIRAVNRKTNP